MAAGEEAKEDHHSSCWLASDGMDGISNDGDGKVNAEDLGPI